MKHKLKQLLHTAIIQCQQQGILPKDLSIGLDDIQIEYSRDKKHGDFASNIAMRLAGQAKAKPQPIAQGIIDALSETDYLDDAQVAGPGFINMYLSEAAQNAIIVEILNAKNDYGCSSTGNNQVVSVEFVSANPTGPLHVGHGRGAAYGSTVSNLLEAVGYKVHREYYVNDAGRQADILTLSVWLRYLGLCGEVIPFPSNGYKGEYIIDIAKAIHDKHGEGFRWPVAEVFQGVAADETAGDNNGEDTDEQDSEATTGDKDAHVDGLILQAKQLLGETGYLDVLNHSIDAILNDIREDLEAFGVTYQEWFSERKLIASNAIEDCLVQLDKAGHLYEREGNIWFQSTSFGDDKDRVVRRKDGRTTYFASDIAYHVNKFQRGADQLIDIFGADHHGYVPRLRAGVDASGLDPDKMRNLLVQFAILYRGKERVQMSTRSGSFVTLRELRDEVGNDAARFFYVMRKSEQHLDFDLELAKTQSADNPVYYIQYAHARICSVHKQLEEKGFHWDEDAEYETLGHLKEPQERTLIDTLARYPDLVETAAVGCEPHLLAHYLRDLANHFHTYYNSHQFIVDDENVRNARFCLITATRYVLANGLGFLGVSAPEAM